MSRLVEVLIPDIGDDGEVDVIEVLVNEGDTVEVEQSLITLESDKASMEVPSSHAGVVKKLRLKVGDKASEGTVILELEEADAAAATDKMRPQILLPSSLLLPVKVQLLHQQPVRLAKP